MTPATRSGRRILQRFSPWTLGAFAAVSLAAGITPAHAEAAAGPAVEATEIPSALVIQKSSNKNQVHYAVRVDESCSPAGPQPVSPYWRMLERGPQATEPLSNLEQRVLGVDWQVVATDEVRLALRILPKRELTIHTWRDADGRCASSVEMTVGPGPARVSSVFVKQKLFGVSYVLLTGISTRGAVVEERVKP
jgi:hypothetical protein